jgi:hypothetical protein
LVALLILLGWPGSAGAQERSLLWKISGDKSTVYLLGSIHYLKKENFPLNKTILAALENSRRLVLEIDLNSARPEAAQKITLSKALYQDGSTLEQNISPETFQLTRQRAAQFGIDIKSMMPMKPWFVSLTLVAIRLQQLGFDPNFGVDRFLAAQAAKQGKPVDGLETLEFQLGAMDQLSKSEQESLLRQSVGELDQLDRSIQSIAQAWLKGDSGALEPLLLDSMKEYPEVYKKLILERNRRWVPQIEKILGQSGATLVVVGAAHLVGKDGVVEMLKERGYKVEQE